VLPPSCQPVEVISVTTGISGCEVTFGAELTGSEPFAWHWDFGAFGTSTEPEPVVDFSVSGAYTGTLVVENCGGIGQHEATFGVEVECAPSCVPVSGTAFSAEPEEPRIGQEITFTAEATGTPPIVFTWQWSDSGAATGAVVTRSFSEAGVHSVVVTATNGCGWEEEVGEITVLLFEFYLPILRRGGR
jgi:PKD repeat protein